MSPIRIERKIIQNIVKEVLFEYSKVRVFKYPYQITSDSPEYKATFSEDYERYRKLMLFLPRLKTSAKVLEVGTGIGSLAVMIKRIFDYQVTTIEHPSRETFKNEKFLGKMKKEGIIMKPVDLLGEMKIKKESFDMVVFSEVLEHLSPTPDIIKKVFDNLTGIIKKGGYIVITTPNVATFDSRWRGFRGVSVQPFPLQGMCDDTYEHIRIYSLSEIKQILEKYKFSFEKVGYSNYIKGKYLSDLRRIISCAIFPSLNADLMVLGKK
ncbi:MAG: hypothetical protein A2452_13040 [Candidatus Firestonebacteria bacterium RIFOXYC2_FULL_39_67]|nr:MAG: hypothetical protein A2536_04370 [Candidatus Firestonebacteria bacterium RIFOXYD2_FULL_39_29]OGF55035.1 MAG: hypothetical protein A2452_13040 [Candidatus Firestonebacteria bacterium RIFOXYC2_FULL_39_67]OGF58019.1 MAG: hypothetical protein A2497_07815 [Candidatus Firestonebacteria bacterium RifOxyC12_full_39_7]